MMMIMIIILTAKFLISLFSCVFINSFVFVYIDSGGHSSSQPVSKSSSSVSLYSNGSEGTAIFGQSASPSTNDLTASLLTALQADGLDNFNPFLPINLLQ